MTVVLLAARGVTWVAPGLQTRDLPRCYSAHIGKVKAVVATIALNAGRNAANTATATESSVRRRPVLTAIIHIGGAIIGLFALSLAGLWLTAWEVERSAKKRLGDAAISLGVSVEELESEAMTPRLIEFCSAKFSSELFRNRLSDLCGVVRLVWGWVGLIVQAIVLLVVVWNTFTDTVNDAVYAWSAIGVALFFWVSSVGFALICYFITGRYPGEAKQARKALSAVLEERKARST